MTHCSMTGMGDVSPVLGIGVFNDGDTGTVTISRRNLPSPCWNGTVWQASSKRTRLVWEGSCRRTSRRRGF